MPNWDHVQKEILRERDDLNGDSATDKVRKRYLSLLSEYTGRNIIGYYSGFLSKPRLEGIELIDEDKNGFMLAIHELDRSKGLDLFIHTPGGNIAATESLVNYLKAMFGNNIRAIVPQIAMSAGTMLACSCKEIIMGNHSNLGPVDPSINGFPAQAILAEIELAYSEIVNDTLRASVWGPILSRYPPSFVQLCKWAVERAEDFVQASLKENMLAAFPETERNRKAKEIVRALIDLSKNKGHDKHLHMEDCVKLGLTIKKLESDPSLQDLVLTVHHCYMHALSNTAAYKVIENHHGRRMVKLAQMVIVPSPQN